MFEKFELKQYEHTFKELGITDNENQQMILEFLYTLGTIIYNKSVVE